MAKYQSYYERQRKKQAERLAGVVGWIVASVAVVVAVVLSINEANTKAEIVEHLKQKHADEMAQCLTDWKAGKNGGCDWEVLEIHNGGGDFSPYGVEVVAKPAQ
jgi:hypothetical protein